MKTVVVAFDCDGTLLLPNNTPRWETLMVLEQLYAISKNVRIIVWSGGGREYAEGVVNRLALSGYVDACYSKLDCPEKVDICFDDVDTTELADKNIVVN